MAKRKSQPLGLREAVDGILTGLSADEDGAQRRTRPMVRTLKLLKAIVRIARAEHVAASGLAAFLVESSHEPKYVKAARAWLLASKSRGSEWADADTAILREIQRLQVATKRRKANRLARDLKRGTISSH